MVRCARRGSGVSLLLLLVASSSLCPAAVALDNGAARTPSMGWNSWNTFHGGVSAEILRETADLFVSLGLREAGYTFVNTDDAWLAHNRSAAGRLVPSAAFGGEAGVRNLSAYIHDKGLQFGMYLAAATTTCMGRAGGLYHERTDASTFAEWQVECVPFLWAPPPCRTPPHACGCACLPPAAT
jgi:alpha-galactosidase